MSADDLSPAELAELLNHEVSELTPELRLTYDQYAVVPVRMMHSWEFGDRRVFKPIWVIARAGAHVVGYDEVEEEFGTGTVRQDGAVDDWGTYGERLQWTLLRFPEDRLGGTRVGDPRPLA